MSPVEQQQEQQRYTIKLGSWIIGFALLVSGMGGWLYDTRAEAGMARSEAREVRAYTEREIARLSLALLDHIDKDNVSRQRLEAAITALTAVTSRLDERTLLRPQPRDN